MMDDDARRDDRVDGWRARAGGHPRVRTHDESQDSQRESGLTTRAMTQSESQDSMTQSESQDSRHPPHPRPRRHRPVTTLGDFGDFGDDGDDDDDDDDDDADV